MVVVDSPHRKTLIENACLQRVEHRIDRHAACFLAECMSHSGIVDRRDRHVVHYFVGVRRTGEALTGMLYINVTPDGQRTFFGSRGANQLVGRLGQKESGLLARARAASLMGYSFLDDGGEAAAQQIIAAVRRKNGWVSLDAGMEPAKKIAGKILRVARTLDLFIVSSEEATLLTGLRKPEKAFLSLLNLGIPEVVMKLGKRGCLIFDEGTLRQVPSFPVRAVLRSL